MTMATARRVFTGRHRAHADAAARAARERRAEPAQSLLPWEEADHADEVEPDAMLSARGLDSAEEERGASSI